MKKWIGAVFLLIVTLFFILQSIGGSMTILHHEIRTTASTDTVWAILSNLEEVAHYNPTVSTASLIEGERARQCVLKDGSVVKERIRDVKNGQAVTMELFESDWPVEDMQWTTELVPMPDGTLIRQTTQYRAKGLMGRIANVLVMKRKIDETIAGVFEGLKKYAEEK